MRIRTGFDIAFETLQPTPMILMVSVHPNRMPDVLTPHVLTFDPPVQTRSIATISATSATGSSPRRAG